MTVLVYGWVALDDIETPFDSMKGALGGSATHALLAASLFTDVRLLAAIGEDFPDEERAKLERPSIDLDGLVTVPGGETSAWGCRYPYDMNSRDTLFTKLGVNADWQPALPDGWERSEMVFLAAAHPVLQRSLLEQCTAARMTMTDTIKLFIDENIDDLRTTMGRADIVTMNDGEARQVANSPSIAQATRALLGTGASGVIIKLGEYGAVFRSEVDYFVAPGYPLEAIVDPTGAGDAFAGAFMGYLDTVESISPGEIRKAMMYATAVASFQVEGLGPSRLLTLEREEVETRYAELRQLTHLME